MKKILCLFSVLAIAAGPCMAQTGTLTGRVTVAETAEPVLNAIVLVTNLRDTTKQKWTYSTTEGTYVLHELPEGEYRISFVSIAHREKTVQPVSIVEGQEVTLDAELVQKVILMEGIVVSASRREQKLLDAPASATVVDAQSISQTPAAIPTEHLRSVAGVDIAQTGLLQQNLVVRGFNNVFSGTLMMLTDHRLAGVPSLRLNAPYLIPLGDDDIERIEVVRGPGSALYGPNASNGVVNFITYSPFSSQGTSVSTMMGERSLFQGTFRHAGTLSPAIGFKLSGLYFRGNDWAYVDPVEASSRQEAIAAGGKPEEINIGRREGSIERFSGEARVDLLLGDEFSAVATAGVTQLVRGIELTDIGAAQARDWRYTYFQGRLSYGGLFLQAFLNQSDAGDTYLLRSGDRIVDRSSQFVAQAQHSLDLSQDQRFVYGADLLLTRPETYGTINGRNEASDDITEYGGYLQSETHLFGDFVDLVLAGRVDKHSQLADPIFSPRAGMTVKPSDQHTFRLTFNRAYSTPTTTDLFLDLESLPNVFGYPPQYAIAVRASGVPKSGFFFDRGAGGRPVMHSPFNPGGAIPVESAALLWPAVVNILAGSGVDISAFPAPSQQEVASLMALLNPETGSFDPVSDVYDINPLKPTITQTIEAGYKGILSEKLQMSIDLYYTRVTNFVGPLQIFTPNVFLNGGDVKTYLKPYIKQALMDQGVPEPQAESMAEDQSTQLGSTIGQIPLGTVTPKDAPNNTAILLASRNFGTVDVQGIDVWADYRLNNQVSLEGTFSYVNKNFFEKLDGITDLSLNAPRSKGSFTVNYRIGELGISAKLRYRWLEGFRMSSGVYRGTVKPGSFVDATVGLDIHSVPGLGATVSATNVFNEPYQYFIGAPSIGRMVVGRLSYAF